MEVRNKKTQEGQGVGGGGEEQLQQPSKRWKGRRPQAKRTHVEPALSGDEEGVEELAALEGEVVLKAALLLAPVAAQPGVQHHVLLVLPRVEVEPDRLTLAVALEVHHEPATATAGQKHDRC